MEGTEFDAYEWDEVKSDKTFHDRGFDFEFASQVFDGNYIEDEDTRKDYGEPRFIVIGRVEDILLTLVWTRRGTAHRIIAAWPSSRQERRRYNEHYS